MLQEFRDVYGMRFDGLVDNGSQTYQTYRVPEPEAPYPQDIIIDQFGRIAYWSWEYDPQEIIETIDYLLTCFCIVNPDAIEPELRLYSPRPTVFSRQTDLWFQLVQPGKVRIDVFDATGRHMRTLLDSFRRAGDQRVVWNGRNNQDDLASEGIYFVRMDARERGQQIQKVILVR